jgi:hypothetical protein
MASTIEELEADIAEAISAGFRGRLLDRGQARSMIWKDGLLPPESPAFSANLSYDLLSYGYSLLGMGLRLRELGGDTSLYVAAFEKAAVSLEDVILKGDPENPSRGFHRVLCAVAHHLARYSAKAYSLLVVSLDDINVSAIEKSLCRLILRDLNLLEGEIFQWKLGKNGDDEYLAGLIEQGLDQEAVDVEEGAPEIDHGIESVELPIINLALEDNYYSALSLFLMALERGDQQFLTHSSEILSTSLGICGELGLVPQWWVHRVTIHLLDDLWGSSFHAVLPLQPPEGDAESWTLLRRYYISLLYRRRKSEVELWPSQIEGAIRAINQSDNLVVSLPTSAGKTRVAELCILRCLAAGKRILFITPLRALSAQTEVALRNTFAPLGKSISTLYGSIGTSDFEEDAMKTRDIVVGTPEKLDFALRNDPTIIDDVGLIVLDEGHMIGLSEREIRYEVQIQRLLKRADADQRRIVCLSAILPEGDQLDDFVGWLRRDEEGEAVHSTWRPTDLRFGEVIWRGNSGTLTFHVGEEESFVPNFIQPFVPPLPNPGMRTTEFPKNAQELTLATAWRLVEDDHTVLIYCPQKRSVEAFAKVIVDLIRRGALPSVLTAPNDKLELARSIGQEWLGHEHPILECLNIGVAIHHATLPTPYRKEIEKLLRDGVLKITVSSPTLAQGLNLAATAVIFQSLYRWGEVIEPPEFKNVIGRAGRAFVDVQGLVIYPIFESHRKRKSEWEALLQNTETRNMESGLLRLVYSLMRRIHLSLGKPAFDQLVEYVANNAGVWEFPEIQNEAADQREEEMANWSRYLSILDTAILSLLGEHESEEADLPALLDEILGSSLWQRRLNRQQEPVRQLLNASLAERAKYIWMNSSAPQRRGYFLAGVGLATGHKLDAIAEDANRLLVLANFHIEHGDADDAISAVVGLAELIFGIDPFTPKPLPANWQEIVEVWLRGESIVDCGHGDIGEVLDFVEQGLVYRLSWGMEAVRVRAEANGDEVIDGVSIDDLELGLAVPAVENGTLNRSAAILMQAGFSSRQGAIQAVTQGRATFNNTLGLKEWLDSDLVALLTDLGEWPTAETSSLWKSFLESHQPPRSSIWGQSTETVPAIWDGQCPQANTVVRLRSYGDGQTSIISAAGQVIGHTDGHIMLLVEGIYYAVVDDTRANLDVTYIGPGENAFLAA